MKQTFILIDPVTPFFGVRNRHLEANCESDRERVAALEPKSRHLAPICSLLPSKKKDEDL